MGNEQEVKPAERQRVCFCGHGEDDHDRHGCTVSDCPCLHYDEDDTAEIVALCFDIEDASKVQGPRGVVPCPRCSGTVLYQYDGPRSMQAKCQGEGCDLEVLA
jgi:hypothetical protein